MLLEECAFRLCFARSIVNGEAKEADETLRLGGCDAIAATRTLVSFYCWFVGTVEDENRLDRGAEKACEPVEEGSDCWVGSTWDRVSVMVE